MFQDANINEITYVFGMAGLSGNTGLIASSIQYVINVVMTVPALIWMDRWGRRPMFVIGAVLMMIWLFANAGLMATYGYPAPPGGLDNIAEQSWQIHGAPAYAVIACTYLFVASYAPTWGPASWVYPPELFPLRVRGKAVALTTSSNWIFVSTSLPIFTFPGQSLTILELCTVLLRAPCIRQHSVEGLHCLRCLLRNHGSPHFLPVPRDSWKDSRGH